MIAPPFADNHEVVKRRFIAINLSVIAVCNPSYRAGTSNITRAAILENLLYPRIGGRNQNEILDTIGETHFDFLNFEYIKKLL